MTKPITIKDAEFLQYLVDRSHLHFSDEEAKRIYSIAKRLRGIVKNCERPKQSRRVKVVCTHRVQGPLVYTQYPSCPTHELRIACPVCRVELYLGNRIEAPEYLKIRQSRFREATYEEYLQVLFPTTATNCSS